MAKTKFIQMIGALQSDWEQTDEKAIDFIKNKPDIAADWNENNPNADNYVKNRTHWEELVEVNLIPEAIVTITEDDNYVELMSINQLQIGQIYIVKLNNIEYKCVAREYDDCVLIGNGTIYGDNDEGNGEPFSIDSYSDGRIYLNVATDGDYIISISAIDKVVHKIDEKYLPELSATPDWNQNDPDAKDYIKNRPFCEEYGYITYIEEQTVTFTSNTSGTKCSASIENVNMPWDWVSYIVTFDGVEYEGTMTDNADTAWIPITLENGTGMLVYSYGGISINSASLAGEHTIKVERKVSVVTTIETKYLGIPASSGEGENSICLNGVDYNIASGDYSHAEGINNIASGDYSHAEGNGTTASGDYSHAEGNGTTASGRYSHAEGINNIASGDYSHAEGDGTTAYAGYQHVSGQWNKKLDGNYLQVTTKWSTAHSFLSTILVYISDSYTFDATTGNYTLVNPQSNTDTLSNIYRTYPEDTKVYYTIYSSTSSTMYMILGRANLSNFAVANGKRYVYSPTVYTSKNFSGSRYDYATIVGNGTSDTKRSNAHTLDWNGVGWYQGGLQVGGNAQGDGAKNVLLEGDAIPVPDVAAVGQAIIVKAVDENGKPIEWEAVDPWVLVDESSGIKYKLSVVEGKLTMEEA